MAKGFGNSPENSNPKRIYGSILLVAGTSIGAGMLALPITTGVGGYGYTLVLFLVCFLFMLLSLFLLLEATLWVSKPSANFVTIAKERLGYAGQIVAWFGFLLLLYAVAAAYLLGGGSLLMRVLPVSYQALLPAQLGILVFALLFGLLVFFGTRYIDYINRILMIGLLTAYVILVILVIPSLQSHNLASGQPRYLWAAIPVVVLSFTSHIILPSLRTYLHGDVKALTKVLWYGSLIPLAFYILWQTVILGVVPYSNLLILATSEHPVAELTKVLQGNLGLTWIAITVSYFSFFALTTSFVGVILSLSDFLADGFSIKKNITGRLLVLSQTILPPLLFALFFPHGFIIALSYAGVLVAILFGILPVLMVWRGRYVEKLESAFRVPGGKPVLLVALAGSCLVIILQLAAVFECLPVPG
ncbi:MAG: tyrP-A [Gammaproteobacteria bacterium]|nr:tyrP-A [Gammaproteobacteria bacterium]